MMRIGPADLMNPIQRVTQSAEWQAFQQRDPDLAAETLGVMKARLARSMVSANSAEIAAPSAAPTIGAPAISGPTILGGSGSSFRGKLPATEQSNVATINGIKGQLIELRSRLQKYGEQQWNETTPKRWKDYYLRRYGNVSSEPYKPGVAADDHDRLVSSLINAEANAKAALAHSAGTRAISYMNDAAGHLPTGKGDFKFNMDNIDYLLSEHGPYNSYLRSVGLDPHAGEPSMGVAKMPEAVPTPADIDSASKKYGGM